MEKYLETSKVYKGFHYSILSSEMLQYLHDKTLEMLRVIIPIFDANNIRYFICGGTLLGAVTTGHFIPWDDDLDICVLDEDYEKMKSILLYNLPDWMLLQCKETEPNYYHGWIKVRDRNSEVKPSEPTYSCNGVWIDLYKLTKTRLNKVAFSIQKEHMDYLFRRKMGGGDFYKRVD